MSFMDDMRSKLGDGLNIAKKGVFFAADKTKKGANIAKIQVEIKLEEGRAYKLQAELGKHVHNLMDNGVFDMSNDATIKGIMENIKKSEDKILKSKEELKKAQVQEPKETTEKTIED